MKNHWKEIYLIVLGLLTVVCIIVGLSRHTSWKGGSIVGLSGKTKTVDQDIESFKNIDFEGDVADVTIEYGNTYHVYCCFPEEEDCEVFVDDETLYIENADGIRAASGVHADGEVYKTVITVPEDVVLESLKCTADVGNVQLAECSFESIEVTADCGNVELNDVNFGTGHFSADAGNITLSNVQFSDAQCDADLGNIEVSGDFDELSAECSMGNITVSTDSNMDEVKLNLDADLGKIKVNGQNWK